MSRRNFLVRLAVVTAALVCAAEAAVIRQTLRGLDAIRFAYGRGKYDFVREACYGMLWRDVRQPEILYYLARAQEKLGDRDQAAVALHLALRALEEGPASKDDPRAARRKALCRSALKRLDGEYRLARVDYAKAAGGKRFSSPEKVSDLWMAHVTCDLRSLHALYAWKLVGGRKDARPDWIHNTQGALHRSGAKYTEEVHGRRGVLFCIPSRKSKSLSRVRWDGPVKGKFLRVGTRAYGFPYVLNLVVGDRQVFSQRIRKDAWSDLRIPIGPEAQQGAGITLELVVPEDQRWHEGAWIDYVDFFED